MTIVIVVFVNCWFTVLSFHWKYWSASLETLHRDKDSFKSSKEFRLKIFGRDKKNERKLRPIENIPLSSRAPNLPLWLIVIRSLTFLFHCAFFRTAIEESGNIGANIGSSSRHAVCIDIGQLQEQWVITGKLFDNS